MRLFKVAACVAALAILTCSAAFAAADTSVSIPIGDWLAGATGVLAPILAIAVLAALLYATKFLPATFQAYITKERIAAAEQLLERAVAFGLNKAAEAAKDKTVEVDVRNEAVAKAAQYAIDHGPEKLVTWMGGAPAVGEKIIARLPIPDEIKQRLGK
ncbi:MAG: hypothetical protein HY834_08865 [Devosia nanyangense]|uniref:Uncharacterized protein n=1 Tax=Devosia nanyangense TaxID=1228055 RepID=A0A933NYU8_9HYPH|nr:hypothetical protein [Devosia nanyangense]